MLVAAFSWGDLWRLALAVFLLAVGISLAYLFVRLAGTATEVSTFIRGAGESALPVIDKVGGSVDRVNGQLDKVDKITDSAVDAADSLDTAVRAVSFAITRPVLCVCPVRTATPFSPSRLKSSRPAPSPIACTRVANHSTLVDSMPSRCFHLGPASSCHAFGRSAGFTALLLYA